MKLFQPNNLSRQKPEFRAVDDEQVFSSLTAALRKYHLNTDSVQLSTIVGANAISENFRVDSNEGIYFLKRRDAEQVAKLKKEAELTAELRELGVKAPRVIANSAGELVHQSDSHVFLLSEFIEGNYFSGRGAQLESASKAFATIGRAARQLEWTSTAIDQTFLTRLPSLLELNTSDGLTRDLMREHQETILSELVLVEAESASIESTVRPLHLDFHPLNLLTRSDEVICVLDFEHLQPYPVAAAVGFAGFKLVREILTNPDQIPFSKTLGEVWLKQLQEEFAETTLTLPTLRPGAAYRILFLIDFILDASLRRGDDRFLFDLEKQILSLYELESLNWV